MSIRVIGAVIGNGAQDCSTEMAAEYLKSKGLVSFVESQISDRTADHLQEISWDTNLYPHFTKRFNKALPVVSEFCDRLHKVVGRVTSNGDFPLILGGDHSCAIGTWSGVAKTLREYGQGEDLGLLWVDAHMDSHTFETTPSNAIHGMPLAALLGYGRNELTDIGGFRGKISPRHTVLVGVRSFEDGERDLLDRLGIAYFTDKDIDAHGLDDIMQKAQTIVSRARHWGMSIDIDAFDPLYAPGVGSPEHNGISPNDFTKIVNGWDLDHNPQFKALEIVEFSPKNDKNDITCELIFNLVSEILIR